MCQDPPECSTIPHTPITCCPHPATLQFPKSQTAQVGLDPDPLMTPGFGHKTKAKASVKGRDRMLASFLVKIGTGKGPKVVPSTPPGVKATLRVYKTQMIISSMTTCMHQIVNRPQCDLEGAADMLVARKLSCCPGPHMVSCMGQGWARQPGVGVGDVPMAPEVEGEHSEAEDEPALLFQRCILHVQSAS